ncbi:DUF952 domain-containing protein [Actinocrispum sp. NPDC049592]|uniref:DUF952 domain-containing protein n=1 Tax=Actinocrispum sp. NPDC049592 TaxID=3154835 RepID=UPI0034155BDF
MILHICGRSEWPESGDYRADSLDEVGFIHCADYGTVHMPAGQFFAGRSDLVLLVIDPDLLECPVRWEEADPPGDNLPWFPHVYGPISRRAVVAVHEFPAGPDGRFRLPAALAGNGN